MSFSEDPDFVMNYDAILDPSFDKALEEPDFLMGFDLHTQFEPSLLPNWLPEADTRAPTNEARAVTDGTQEKCYPPSDFLGSNTRTTDGRNTLYWKSTVEYLTCGHARASDLFGEFVESDMHNWSAFDVPPSETQYLFTDCGCGQSSCFRSSQGITDNTGNTVVREQYSAIDPVDLQSRYETYCNDVTDIGNKLTAINSDCLLAVWALKVPVLRDLFEVFPTCFVGDSTMVGTALGKDDIGTLLDRIFQEQNPDWVVQILCRLASRTLAPLVDDLRFYNVHLNRLTKLSTDMWLKGCLAVYDPATSEDLPVQMTVRNEMAEAEFGPDVAEEGMSIAYPFTVPPAEESWTPPRPASDISPLTLVEDLATLPPTSSPETTQHLRSLRDMVEAGETSFGPHVSHGSTAQVVEYNHDHSNVLSTMENNAWRTSDGTIAKRRMAEKERAQRHESIIAFMDSILKREASPTLDGPVNKGRRMY